MGKVAVVTGITGQDGGLLARHLLHLGYNKVIGIDRRTSSKTDWRLREQGLYNDNRFYVASGDITDAGSVARIVQDFKPDEFYNLAAMSFVKESWNTPAATLQINAIGCINCLEALRHHKRDCKFYQASSSEMFGGANRLSVLDENSSFYPRSPYGVSKVTAHWATVNYRESFDMFTCCGILFNHESEYRGLEFVTRKITDGIARIYMGQQDHIELGNLDAKRDWGYAGDFVRGMHLMLQHSEPDDYVLATGTARSIREFLVEALETAGFPIEDRDGSINPAKVGKFVKQNPAFMRPADVGHLLGNAQKAMDILGWQPEISFEDMVRIMVEKDIERVRDAIRR
jgi:GDPmannose 4,6-dehydratase